MKHKGYGDIKSLDFSKGGIPKTGASNGNKNRQALMMIDRDKYDIENVMVDVANLIYDLILDKVDTIVIDVKERTW